jgi:flavodoxin/NAD-dependent dihydropyrimidine dehydrogenase PreA subunit
VKSIIVYYTQTGNTQKIAEAIHAGMSQLMPCDIRRLKEVDPGKDLIQYDLIGLGSPVWGGNVPHVISFIEDMNHLDGKHAFVFCTHGTAPRGFLARAVPALIQRGLTVIGWNDWYGRCRLPMMPVPYFTDGHPDEIDLKEAEDFGKELVERSRRIYQGETQLIPAFPRGKEYDDIYGELPPETGLGEKHMKPHNFPYKINVDKCTKCNLCVEYCPTNSIDFSSTPPRFLHTCCRCLLCEEICPAGAMEYDWEPASRQQVKMFEDFLLAPLDKAEARGHFRRLVPKETVGWDTRWYQVTKPPRFKLCEKGYFEPIK